MGLKYSLYNVVWYDGVNAYVTKFILKSDKDGKRDLLNFWKEKGIDGRVLEVDLLYSITLENIISFSNGDGEQKQAFKYFKEMYF